VIQAPTNKVIVFPKTKYIKHISDLLKRSSIQNGATVDPSDFVNIIGEVISVPEKITDDRQYKGFSLDNIKVGDIAIFSYRVIYDLVVMADQEEPAYRNLIKYNGKEYFSCDIRNLFGIIRDGEIHMVNGFVMLAEFEANRIIIAPSMKNRKMTKSSKIMHIGGSKTHMPSLAASAGDFVFYNPEKAQHYEINGKKFIILQQDKILGKQINP